MTLLRWLVDNSRHLTCCSSKPGRRLSSVPCPLSQALSQDLPMKSKGIPLGIEVALKACNSVRVKAKKSGDRGTLTKLKQTQVFP